MHRLLPCPIALASNVGGLFEDSIDYAVRVSEGLPREDESDLLNEPKRLGRNAISAADVAVNADTDGSDARLKESVIITFR